MYDTGSTGIDNVVSLVERGWGLSCDVITAGREQSLIKINNKTYKLRVLDMLEDSIAFVHEAKEYIAGNGFDRVDRYVPAFDGRVCFTDGDKNYIMTECLSGRECDFGNNIELKEVSASLGMMHKASRGFKPSSEVKVIDYLGQLPTYYKKRCDELKRHLKDAKRRKGKFDLLYASYGVKYCELAENCINKIKDSKYYSLVEEYRKKPVICHHDIIYRNTILAKNVVNIINFELCCIEICAYDIINLIRRRMRKCGWERSSMDLIIDNYCKYNSLSDAELEILKVMLVFPQKLWRIVNKYYNSRRGWGERAYVSQLMELFDEMEETLRVEPLL